MTIRKFYTIFDIAKMFNRSRVTIYRWISNGTFPRGKAHPGGMIWTEEVINRWIDEGQVSDKEMKAICDMKNM